jgi:hypothetical protein
MTHACCSNQRGPSILVSLFYVLLRSLIESELLQYHSDLRRLHLDILLFLLSSSLLLWFSFLQALGLMSGGNSFNLPPLELWHR